MGRIHLLDEAVIHKIAAGEVVQRPASVLKELVENALDAEARRVVLRLERMGKRLIEVEDDGIGMSRSDALLSIERHATSKIASEEDILRVATLGFRGEALPSIAAVSRMTLMTRRREDEVGTEISLEGGRIRQVRDCGMAPGTVVRVRNLFYNTPARRHFLKSDRTEGFHLFRTFYALSLVNLDVQMEIIQEGRRVVTLPAVERIEDRFTRIWPDILDQSMAPVDARFEGARLWGILATPPFIRSRGRGIFFFLNRRWITDRKILRAVLSAYHSVAPKGFVPDGVLCLDLPPHLVDVNVHPSKFEVRLSREYETLGWIQKTVASALSVRPNPVHEALEANVPPALPVPESQKPSMVAGKTLFETVSTPLRPFSHVSEAAPEPYSTPAIVQEPTREHPAGIPRDYTILGVVANTYIVASYEGGIFIVDKHAAHERLIFERLKRAFGKSLPSQRCLLPVVFSLDEGEVAIFNLSDTFLRKMGIVLEPFGEGSLRVVSLPAWVRQEEAESLVRELLQEFAETPTMEGLSDRVDKFLATIACHSASRGQDPVSVPEAYALLDQVVNEKVPLACPHGRPFIHFLPLKELEKIFDR